MGEVKNQFELPDKKVTIKFIPRKRGMYANVEDDHVIAGGMMSKSVKKFVAPIQRNGAIMNVLTNEEKKYLENRLQEDLSIYKDFWANFTVNLMKDDANNILDLNNPLDYISYKILKSWKNHIAPDWASRNSKGTYQFAITEDGEEFVESKKALDYKKEAFKAYGKIEDNKDQLLGVLRLVNNKPISSQSKLDWLQGKVEEYLDQKPKSFVELVKDPAFFTRILVNKAVDSGVIKRESNKYISADGLELCENAEIPTFENAVRYLDNPKNQDIRSLIEAKTNNAE